MKNMKKILNKIASNELVLIWAVTFALAVILLLVTLFVNRSDKADPYRDVPKIKTEKDTVGDFNYAYWDNDEYPQIAMSEQLLDPLGQKQEQLSDNLVIYKEVDSENIDGIRAFVTATGLELEESIGDYYAVWEKDNDRVVYNRQDHTFFFEFETPVVVDVGVAINSSSSQSDYERYFEHFINKFIDQQIQFGDYQYLEWPEFRFGKDYMTRRLTANRLVGKSFLYFDDVATGSNYLLFDDKRSLLGGKIEMVRLIPDSEKSSLVKEDYYVVEHDLLDKYVLNKYYPKLESRKYATIVGGDEYGLNAVEDYLDLTREGEYKFPVPEVCTVTEADIGYYYVSGADVVPVYKLDCVGIAWHLESKYEIESVLILKAILPK